MNHLLPATLVLLILLNGTITYTKFPYRKKLPLAHFSNDINQQKANSTIAPPPDTPFICSDTSQRLLFHEDTIAVTANFIIKTNDGNFLIPGYYNPNNGIYYKMPYLIKSTAEGNIVWSKRYSSLGVYPSQWIIVSRIKELNNGDLLMTGEIGVPGTDDRRELAVWRLDKNGKPLWGTSYESSLWTNPITGATAITGIQEDANGNIFLGGDLKFFETSKYAFVLKLDARGNVVWDKNCSSNSAFAHGILLLQNKLLLIGSIGPIDIGGGTNTNVLWCIQLNTDNGEIESTKGWYADFGQGSLANSFADVNGSVNVLDDGQISVHGTAYSDFLHLHASNGDTINHSIIANFSPDFVFQSGIMLSSRYATNYYNTVATQHANGRISYTRFMDNNNLYNENIIYGNIQNNQIIRERIYQEQNRSSQSVSNFLFYSPNEDIVIQTYSNQARAKGGLEIMRLYDSDSSSVCNGKDTSLTFIQPYFMKPTQVTFDSIVTNAFQQTYHNFVGVDDGDIFKSTGCTLAGVNVRPAPVVYLDKNSVLCIGSNRELTPGQGYRRYTWNNQSTGTSILVSDTGKYWVSVTDQNGCTGSDTTYITRIASIPSDFLPPDTTVCDFARLTIVPAHTYQSYLWSDQSTNSSLTVSQAGLYRLVVTDSNQCMGSDSLLLTQKQCLEGLFVPNAFTPNDDGRNDVLRPLLLGNIIRFRFVIYNRWGEKVFETHTPGQGWDGKRNGIPAAEGAFVWYCEYQLDGQREMVRKGTVVVIY